MTQYDIVEHIVNNKYDLSYLKPKEEKTYIARCLDDNSSYECGFDGLIWDNEHSKKFAGALTDYHKLYTYPHISSVIVNKGNNNGKKLLILGDSQMIPCMPILASIYEVVYYYDDRNKHHNKEYLDVDFDDVLIELYNDSFDYMIQRDLM